jgi:lipopolysaccharide transport system ATP-binding protein
MDPADVLLRLTGVGKRYEIYPNDRSRLLELLGTRTHHVEHWALRDLDLEVRRGHALGIIGSNGAGKSTLLRVLAGISEPTEGTVSVRGRMATLLDLGVGFHDTFTGRENIALSCRLLGLDDAEIRARIPEILRFAELGDFIDHPVRTYSAGMNLRLGFAIAANVSADVLVIDEVLAVGDQYFQRKCIDRVEQSMREGATLVLVSHDLHAVRSLCDEVAWLDAGRIVQRGRPRDVIQRYLERDDARRASPAARHDVRTDVRTDAPPRAPEADDPSPPHRSPYAPPAAVVTTPLLAGAPTTAWDDTARARVHAALTRDDARALFDMHAGDAPREMDGDVPRVSGTGEARIVAVRVLDGEARPTERLRTGEPLTVAVTFRTTRPIVDPIFGVALFRADGTYVFGPNTRWDGVLAGDYHGVYTFYVHYPSLPLLAGGYRVSVAIYDRGHVAPHAWHNQLYGFEVVQDVEDHGLVRIPHAWGLITHHAAAPPEGR